MDSVLNYYMSCYNSTGVTDIYRHTNSIAAFPNPARNEVNIAVGSDVKAYSVTMRNMMGIKVLESDEISATSAATHTFNIATLPPGIYLLEMNIDGKRQTSRIVKE